MSVQEENFHLENNFSIIFNNLEEIILIQNLNQEILWANKAALDFFKKALEDIQGSLAQKLFFDKTKTSSKKLYNNLIIKAIETSQKTEGEIQLRNNKTLKTKIIPFKEKNNSFRGIIQISSNISNKKDLQKKVKLNQQKNILLDSLSHDLRTPLNLIYSATQLLETKTTDKTFETYIEIIQNNYFLLLKMVNNMLDMSKIDAGHYKLNLQNNDIVKITRNMLDSLKEVVKSKQRKLIFQTEFNKKIIACDMFNIERVILNLLSNAIKFTEKNDKIIVSLNQDKNFIILKIKDTGIGIKKENLNQIFKRFSQANQNNQGTGLGLTIAKYIIKLHGGEIAVESKPGKFTEFIIKLPDRKINNSKESNNRLYTINNIALEFSDIISENNIS